MYAVDNRYYSDKGEEYSDGITREHPRPRTTEWRETIFVNDKPFSANLTRLHITPLNLNKRTHKYRKYTHIAARASNHTKGCDQTHVSSEQQKAEH